MTNFLKYVLIFSACILCLTQQTGCRKCKEGCDTIFTVNGAALNFSDTTVELSKGEAITTISIDEIVSKKKGDRDCKYKNEVSCREDGLDTSRLSIYCNKELILDGNIYPMNTDLLQVPSLVRASNDPTQKLPFILLHTTASFPKGRYHFLIQGTTNNGKEVEDIGVVSWE